MEPSCCRPVETTRFLSSFLSRLFSQPFLSPVPSALHSIPLLLLPLKVNSFLLQIRLHEDLTRSGGRTVLMTFSVPSETELSCCVHDATRNAIVCSATDGHMYARAPCLPLSRFQKFCAHHRSLPLQVHVECGCGESIAQKHRSSQQGQGALTTPSSSTPFLGARACASPLVLVNHPQ